MELNNLFNKLWTQYVEESPLSLKIHDLFVKRGENVINDHVAFRTFDDSRVNIECLAKFFKKLGYEERGDYHFKIKKLYAKHYEHTTDPLQPKIFISELKSQEFSPYLQEQIKKCVDKIPTEKLNSVDFLYSGELWGDLDYDVYQKLLSESEYAAWMYVFGFRANHFTVLINQLKTLTSVEAVNQFLKEQNIELNTSGGEIKGNPSEHLEQSSTIANQVMIKFKQGEFPVLNSYYEFARRYPMANGQFYQGFVATSADKIFESTDINRK
jgi:hypothetical protein